MDGNKRTGLLATLTFLELNGATVADEDVEAAFGLVLDVAVGTLSDVIAIDREIRRVLLIA